MDQAAARQAYNAIAADGWHLINEDEGYLADEQYRTRRDDYVTYEDADGNIVRRHVAMEDED